MSAFIRLVATGREIHRDASYRWDNRRRANPETFVIQRTLSGLGFLENPEGRFLAPPGHALAFSHAEPSTYGYPPEATPEPYELAWFAFAGPGAREAFLGLRNGFGPVLRLSASGTTAARFDELCELDRTLSLRDRLEGSERVHALLVATYREQSSAQADADAVERAAQFLENHFRRPLALKEIAGWAGISREHFCREFTRRRGMSPGNHLRNLRLHHARALLDTGRQTLREAASASGWGSVDSLRRALARHPR